MKMVLSNWCVGTAVLLAVLASWNAAAAPGPSAGVVFASWPIPVAETEAQAVRILAQQWDDAVPVKATGKGLRGVAPEGTIPSVLWIHQGDESSQDSVFYSDRVRKELLGHIRDGGGLFLSGAALSLVHLLGIEPAVPRRGGPGRDRATASFVPVRSGHPIFRGLEATGGRIPVSNAGYPAFSDFHATGGPFGGMLLARTPGGSENPLVEYSAGRGRVIAMGWRLPHFGHADNRHRGNLERLTRNVLVYLSQPEKWVAIEKPPAPPRADAGIPVDPVAVRRSLDHLAEVFGPAFPAARELRRELDALAAQPDSDRLRDIQRRLMLENPLLDIGRILLVRRHENRLGLPRNWQSNSSLPASGYDNELVLLDLESGTRETLFRPGGRFVGDVELHPDADRILFSMPGSNGRWQVHEMLLATREVTELSLIHESDVDNYDACYLPDGNIVFTSTAPFVGVPCVKGSSHVANLFRYERDSGQIRQLAFDQDHDWCPTVLPNGRVLYLRWEYSDLPHFASRILFHMNPDGTEQSEYYGSNSYWPNALFYARPIPHSATCFVAIVGGHHDDPRMGELILFDAARGRHEADGVIQRIPGYGKRVEPILLDGLVRQSWPKFLHPWPLGGRRGMPAAAGGTHMLVSAKLSRNTGWGLYLVDIFDNMLLLDDEPGYALLEPIPLAPRPTPPVVPSKVDPGRTDGTVLLQDVYAGPGLTGVPRGEVTRLRLISYHFAYHGMGGQINRVGLDGPWDVKRILGTVPVDPDGSAVFSVPANTPIAVQPLDAEGKALQLMRSWFTVMPGEVLSCVGCHEPRNSPPVPRGGDALQRAPSSIIPWYGPARGFSFIREVQPVLDRLCVRCHDGSKNAAGRPDFRHLPPRHPAAGRKNYNTGTSFTPAYLALRSFVRSPTIESDMHLLPPGEFHADTTRLIRILEAGHHGVELDEESRDRLVTWIDLHAPAHGTWAEVVGGQAVQHLRERRKEMLTRYANRRDDPEAIPDVSAYRGPIRVLPPRAESSRGGKVSPPGGVARSQKSRALRTPDGLSFGLVRLSVEPAVWIGTHEVTNEQYAVFDPAHDSRLEHGDFLQFSVRERGYPVNDATQPVVRISWNEAVRFCEWLSERTGEEIRLPSETEWTFACRAESSTPLWYGTVATDFAEFANLADASLRAVDTFGFGLPSGAVPPWRPAVTTVDDGHRVSAPVGSFRANRRGLYDMHGNAAEWTRSSLSGASTLGSSERMIVLGGSWYDRPGEAGVRHRRAHRRYLPVFDVGFRIVSCGPVGKATHARAGGGGPAP